VLSCYLNEKVQFHQWAKKQFINAAYPLLTCEAVISETWFLLNKRSSNPNLIMHMLKEGIFKMPLLYERRNEFFHLKTVFLADKDLYVFLGIPDDYSTRIIKAVVSVGWVEHQR